MSAKNKPNEIQITRVYDAPVKVVWEAWADPKQAAKWWGPRGFTITTHAKDLRAGGFWHYTMHGPDGVDYPNKTKYFEVEKYSKMVYDHGGNDEQAPMFRVTVLFKAIKEKGKEKTQMDMTMAFANAEIFEHSKKVIKQANGNSTWDRLGEFLDKESTGRERFIINRSFEAPIETMFEMWTKPEHIQKWLPPTGMEMQFLNADIRSGGSSFYKMGAPGITMHGQANYIEIEKPHRIVYTQQFTDENRNLSRHPMAPTWPATMLTGVTLTEEGPNQTRVTIEWDVHGSATPEEIATFVAGRPGMTQGWTGSFDKLDELLAQRS